MTIQRRHREIVEVARRIVRRHEEGKLDIAAELIMRALATSDSENTFALAVALTDEALAAVEESRLDAASNELAWQPAFRTPSGQVVTPADTSTAPIPLAMRMIAALHHGMGGDKDAVSELGDVYEQAARADDATFHGLFAALATYAAHGRRDRVEVLTEPLPT